MRPAEMGAREAIRTGSEQQAWRLGIRDGREMQVVRGRPLCSFFFGAGGLSLVCRWRAAAMWRFDARRRNFFPLPQCAMHSTIKARHTDAALEGGPLRVDGLSFVVAQQVRAL